MNKFILTLVIIWIVWKVAKSVIEEIQARAEKMLSEGRDRMERASPRADRMQTPPRPSVSASSRGPENWELGQSVPGEEESELERWYREATERKRRIDRAAKPAPPAARERIRVEPTQPRAAQPRVARRRVEPRQERRRRPEAEQRRITRPREPADAKPASERWEPAPEAPKPREFRRAPRRDVRQKPCMAELLGAGEWNMDDIRRGIIIAEILGPPKALTDIDTHAI